MVYEYGCLPPTRGEEAMLAEMKARNDLWNRLVEIDRAFREKTASLLSPEDNPLETLRAELKTVRDEIKARRKKSRTGKVETEDLRKKAAELRERIAIAAQSLRAHKERIKEANRHLLEEAEAERRAAVKEAVRTSPLFWCNKEDVLASYEVARKRAMKEGRLLQFHRWTGEGKISVRYQQGLKIRDLFSGRDTRLQVDPVPNEAWESPNRSVRRRAARTKVRLRVTSGEDHRPVWVELPTVLHRPIRGEQIQSAAIVRWRVGDRFRHKLVLTVRIPEAVPKASGPAVGIDIGWRKVEGGLRVAFWFDELGDKGELILPERLVWSLEKPAELQSVKDNHFNAAKTALAAWLGCQRVPEWLVEETAGLDQWRNVGRLLRVLERWEENRFPGDEEMVAYLREWKKRDRHLRDWLCNLRDQAILWRREEYRKFAAALAKKYSVVFLEDFDLRQVQRKPAPESGTQGSLPADRQRVLAAVSTLRSAIANACRREGVRVVFVEASFTTLSCNSCGHTEKWDAAKWLVRICPKCKAVWDQDENAAKIILRRGLSKMREISGQEENGRDDAAKKDEAS